MCVREKESMFVREERVSERKRSVRERVCVGECERESACWGV